MTRIETRQVRSLLPGDRLYWQREVLDLTSVGLEDCEHHLVVKAGAVSHRLPASQTVNVEREPAARVR